MRKIATALIALCMAVGTAGCIGASGGDSGQAAPEGGRAAASDPARERITISIYYPTPDLPENRAHEDDKIRRFTARYPYVDIIKSNWQYSPNEIGIKMASGEAPTLFNTFASEGRYLAERGWAADITELYEAYPHKEQINPLLQDQFRIAGRVYGLAERGYVTGVIINKKLLEDRGVQPPSYDWTWDDLLAVAGAASNPLKGISGIAPMGKGNEAGWNWTNFLFEAGGDILTVDGGKVRAAFHGEAGLRALELYRKLAWDARAIPKDWAVGWNDAISMFVQGKTAMIISGPDSPIIQALNQWGMPPEDVLFYPMPSEKPGGKHTGILGGDYLVINPNATPEEQETAFRYATFDMFTEQSLEALDAEIAKREQDGQFYIAPFIPYYKDDSEYGRRVKSIYERHANVYAYDDEASRLFDGKVEVQYNTQQYYGAVTSMVQAVFADPEANLNQLLQETAKTVQSLYFDRVNVPGSP
ncbi:ABC transporter substrate-binding protein [Paenibacillus methanolicus]|uniref:ABC-type glycerol-3-phosphate transport system substrate-binding protein n=1 Tax=Paenibacillus methanolicus TaxID=582686 RepID=A0A5S5BU16_9BACL|nr:extracellular solute-binding protein [Paenibacillus methanolicus]TYP69796.1 ABC-type glycerol-3-phosphate transport system substrate-binding protein [Paenibacillus methanolicus]